MLILLALMSALFPALVHFTTNGSDVVGLWDSFRTTVAIAFS